MGRFGTYHYIHMLYTVQAVAKVWNVVVGKVSKSPPILKSLQKSTGALYIITLPKKDQKLEKQKFSSKMIVRSRNGTQMQKC